MDELDFLPDDKPKNTGEERAIFTPGTIALIVGMVAVAVALGLQLFRQNQTQPLPGQRAPDFTFETYDGQTVTLSELRGTIVVVNFWANWCPPCHAEAPDLQDIYEEYADEGVLLIGLNWLDIEADALGFIERYGITYPNGPDIGQRIAKRYNFEAPPETFVVGRDGIIAYTAIGQVNYDTLAGVLEGLLAEDDQ